MSVGSRISQLIAFVRGGYPTNTPARGHNPLLALLPRRLCDDEVELIAFGLLRRQRRFNTTDIGVEITRVTDNLPSAEDMLRVCEEVQAIAHCNDRWR